MNHNPLKSLNSFSVRHLDDGNGLGKVIFTNRIQINESMRLAFSAAPIIFQDEIIKKSDIRVTVVNDDVISVQIHSQEHSDTRTDWRKGARVDLNYSIFDLPDHIETQCVKIVQSLGLRFAAIDLILDNQGDLWFLEANPNGQWAWIEQRTGAPITSKIVNALEKI
ncbi:hypothetical protein GWK63_16540 [Komagataeibacter rhaeticus]|uniref:ATP-grasp fold RimK-type domain-containing protein n=1 Tax=Komagataeibacter rhaeticus TaxID=215221 RepID=A0A858JRN0_9PROT|nr:hypothetical protein [Komagataeibacter rhaeticus]QIP36807.1 hypothetical protein GWK63_16540 [Komagataeibacter rhaeticus]